MFRSPNVGFKDASNLAAAGKIVMEVHFPERVHKLKLSDIRQADDYLERAFSDDVSVKVFLPMIKEEDVDPTLSTHQIGINLTFKKKWIS